MTKLKVTADLKQIFYNLTICLDDVKKEGGNLWWFLITVKFYRYKSHTIGGVKKPRAGRLSSYLGLLNNELQVGLDIDRGKVYRSWKRKFGRPIHTHEQGRITRVVLKEPVDKGMDWEHLPRDQINGTNKRIFWVGCAK